MNEVSKLPIERGLAAKVYLLAYEKPKSGYEIAFNIYNHDQHRVRGAIDVLALAYFKSSYDEAKEFYLLPVKGQDKRSPKWVANPNVILAKILEENLLNDEYALEQILNSAAFKFIVNNSLPDDLQNTDLNALEYIFSLMDLLFIVSNEVDYFKQESREIKTKKAYLQILNKIKGDKDLAGKLQRLVLPLFNPKNDPSLHIPNEVFEDFLCLFVIPERLAWGFRGQSEFGRTYYRMKPVVTRISNLIANSKVLSSKK